MREIGSTLKATLTVKMDKIPKNNDNAINNFFSGFWHFYVLEDGKWTNGNLVRIFLKSAESRQLESYLD